MKRYLSILLCLVLLMSMLAGCGATDAPEAYVPTGDALEMENPNDEEIPEESEEEAEQSLSLAYYADRSMNPLETTDFTNRALMPLIYQGLFAVNRNYDVIPILCESYAISEDMKTYEFRIDPKATFSDGVPVMAEDVVASLKTAGKNSCYSGRLRFVRDVTVTEDGAVRVYLSQANENLPLLLDIPIVKADQVEEPNPLGTGPYVLAGSEYNRVLNRRSNWWCRSRDLLITAGQIPLVASTSTTSIRDAFEFDDVGVVCTDPGSDRYVDYRCDYELWDCETGIFLYLGINSKSSVFSTREVRQAISRGIDRDYLVDEYYQGFAVTAELPASPKSPCYAPTLAQHYAYDPLQYQDMISSVKGWTVRLLVNEADSFRVKVAHEISRMLSAGGLIVEVQSVPSDEYRYKLRNGEYDLYLGQTKLSPNMDLTPFFSENGALSYGGMDSAAVYSQCLQALENQGNFYALHQSIMDSGYLCPILFRNYAVYAVRGLVTDLEPARDNLFCYTVGKDIAETYLGILE